MKLAVETFVCCFIIAAGMFLNVVYCANTKVVSNAKQYQSAAVHKMDAAGFSKAVVEQCRKEAKEDGYVSLDVLKEQADENRARSLVTLKYKLYVPLLRIEKVCQIRSYANSVTEDCSGDCSAGFMCFCQRYFCDAVSKSADGYHFNIF